jgi:hypothetical protein
MSPPTRLHTDAVIDALTDAGLNVGDGIKPDSGGWQGVPGQSVFQPYVIVYQVFGMFDGTLDSPDEDAELEYQFTCVGETRTQVEGVKDAALAATVGQTITTTGRAGLRCWCLDTGDTRRDESLQGPPVFIATPRVHVYTTPT